MTKKAKKSAAKRSSKKAAEGSKPATKRKAKRSRATKPSETADQDSSQVESRTPPESSGPGAAPAPDVLPTKGQTEASAEQAPSAEVAPEQVEPVTEERCVVVGVGASAGGLEALRDFLGNTPKDCGLAFVLIQHLDPNHKSLMADLLSKYTSMPVTQAEHAMRVEPNHVYMIPPNRFIRLHDEGLFLEAPVTGRGLRMPIDFFFRSLAEQRQRFAIGVVLSGTGSDGTQGLREIKARGGMTIVQDPVTAGYDAMPRSALAAGVVDYVLPLDKMSEELLRYVKHPYLAEPEAARPALLEADPDQYGAVIEILRAHTNYDFRSYKKGTLGRRIQRRMGLRHIVSLADYLEFVRTNPDEIDHLFRDLLINVTAFFRDGKAWSMLEQSVIRPLVRSKADDDIIRVWVPGCATGEEAYTLAMIIDEEMHRQGKRLPVQIFATDLDEEAIQVGRGGIYSAHVIADVPAERLNRHFTEVDDHSFQVVKRLRENTVFAVQDLIGDPPFSNLDLVSCRNVMIYLEADVQYQMLRTFHFALAPNGHAFLGPSETLGKASTAFDVVSKEWRIFRKKGVLSRPEFDVRTPRSGTAGALRTAGLAPDRLKAAIDHAKLTLLERFAPAAVLVNRNLEVVHYLHGSLRDYLSVRRGEPTTDLSKLCLDGLGSKLRTAVSAAVRQRRSTRAVVRSVIRDRKRVTVTIVVEPLPHRQGEEPFVLVSFADGGRGPAANAQSGPEPMHVRSGAESDEDPSLGTHDTQVADDGTQLRELELELQTAREDLQGTIEQFEASNEELKASNEEVMSMNEELQSANEELETSREELQSLNEELCTVNSQLQEKIGELESANDDLFNLLTSTEIATIFLDTELCIRRFTPTTTELLRVIPTDVGRPISDLVSRFNDPHLQRDARAVLSKLTPIETQVRLEPVPSPAEMSNPGQASDEVAAEDDLAPRVEEVRWFIRRILPYRTSDRRIDGVVITFTDVTRLNAANAELERRQQQAAAIATLGRVALESDSVQVVLSRAVELVSETLGTEMSKVLELLPSKRSLLMRAGVGWKEGLAGRATVLADLDSQAGFTLHTAAPVIVRDMRTERRFSGPALLFDHEVVSGISVLIGPVEAPWGVFGTHSKRRIEFGADDAQFVESVAHILYEAIQRRVREDELQDRQRRLRLITDAMPVLIAYCDKSFVYGFCNAQYKEWFGLDPDEVVGRSIESVVGAEAFELLKPYLVRAMAGEHVTFTQELPYRHGEPRCVQVTYVPHVRPSGAVAGCYAMIEDVSGRVELEHATTRLAAIVDCSNDAIIGKDLEGIVTSWNAAAERLYGYSAEEMIGQPLARILPESRAGEVMEIINRLRRGEEVEHMETVRMARDGSEIHIDLTASPMYDARGELVGVSAIVRNISDRIERESELRESQKRFHLAKEAAQLGIFDYNIDDGSIEWDARVRGFWEIGLDEEVTLETFYNGLHPDDWDSVRDAMARAVDPHGDGKYVASYRVIGRQTGIVRWIDANGLVSRNHSEELHMVGTVRDVSESRRAQAALETADRRKDQFLATLGHELRNPLAALVNSIELLRRGAGKVDRKNLFEVMMRQAAHMTRLLNDLLDIARISKGDIELRLEHVRFDRHFATALESVASDLQEREHQVELVIEPEDLGLVVDPVRLEQILSNLLHNAAKYTPGPSTIKVHARATDDGVEVTVADDGVGLTSSEASSVFEIFYQTRKGSGGLGIGLSLVKTLVEIHGGTVEALSSGPGQGTTMRLTLPWIQTPAPTSEDAGQELPSSLDGLRVLVVDDHEDSLAALRELLQPYCEVRVALTGAAGIEEASRFGPNVLLLDLALPDMNGLELAEAIERDTDSAGTRKIAMTGFGDPDTARQVSEAGFCAHLTKPIDFDRLLVLLGGMTTPG